MRRLSNIVLYKDMQGREVSTPVLRVGSGSPHVVMVALQHGWEVIGLDTALRVLQDARPKGTLTLISVASPMAYQERTRLTGQQLGPSSGQQVNMNRIHPGRLHGNIAERSAWAIDKFIQSLQPDAIIDLHSYASQSIPHGIVDPCPLMLRQRIEHWMKDSAICWYREYDPEVLSKQTLDQALSAIWIRRGIPAITLELGPLNAFSPAQSRCAQQALKNVLVAIGAIEGSVVSQVSENMRASIWQRSEIVYRGKETGYFRPLVSVSEQVRKNQVLAEVVVPSGEVVDTIRATSGGLHFIWHDEYRVFPGSVIGVQLIKNDN